jgi:hypothetical protein
MKMKLIALLFALGSSVAMAGTQAGTVYLAQSSH